MLETTLPGAPGTTKRVSEAVAALQPVRISLSDTGAGAGTIRPEIKADALKAPANMLLGLTLGPPLTGSMKKFAFLACLAVKASLTVCSITVDAAFCGI